MKIILTLLLSLALIGCSGNDPLPDIPADTGEQQMYEESQRYLRGENFDLAVRSLQLLESRYPFGKYAEQAQLELIYAHYNAFEHEAALRDLDLGQQRGELLLPPAVFDLNVQLVHDFFETEGLVVDDAVHEEDVAALQCHHWRTGRSSAE